MRRNIRYVLLLILIVGFGFFSSHKQTDRPRIIDHHIIEKHIAKTKQQLQQRLQREDISAASSFYNAEIAEKAIQEAIVANDYKIKHYLTHKKHRYLTVSYQTNYNIGVCLLRDNEQLLTTDRVKVVIAKESSLPHGYKIITAYPIP